MRWSNGGAAMRRRVRLLAVLIAPRPIFFVRCGGKRARKLNRRRLVRVIIALFAVIPCLCASAQAPPAPTARFVVVLDAAHGGDDSGARIGNLPEKTITLALSVRLRSLLAARGISVVTTRESDVTLDPEHRAEIANHADAQACLSLHASMTGSGVHLFISSLAPARPVPFEPWNSAQAAWVLRSLALEGTLNSALQHAGLTVTLGRTALPVIDSMTCPAVAVEVAPENELTHASAQAEAAGLDDPDYQARVADALAAALVEWRSEGANMGVGQP